MHLPAKDMESPSLGDASGICLAERILGLNIGKEKTGEEAWKAAFSKMTTVLLKLCCV